MVYLTWDGIFGLDVTFKTFFQPLKYLIYPTSKVITEHKKGEFQASE